MHGISQLKGEGQEETKTTETKQKKKIIKGIEERNYWKGKNK